MEDQKKNFIDSLISIMHTHNIVSIAVDSDDVVKKIQAEFPDIVCIPNAYSTKCYILVHPDNIDRIMSSKDYYEFGEFIDYVIIFKDGKLIELEKHQLDFLMKELERAGRYDLLIKNNG